MPDTSYMILLERRDGEANEELYFTEAQEAQTALANFDEEDSAELYTKVSLIEVSWIGGQDKVLEVLEYHFCTCCGNVCFRDDDHNHTVVFMDDTHCICEECSLEYEEVNGKIQVRERDAQ